MRGKRRHHRRRTTKNKLARKLAAVHMVFVAMYLAVVAGWLYIINMAMSEVPAITGIIIMIVSGVLVALFFTVVIEVHRKVYDKVRGKYYTD